LSHCASPFLCVLGIFKVGSLKLFSWDDFKPQSSKKKGHTRVMATSSPFLASNTNIFLPLLNLFSPCGFGNHWLFCHLETIDYFVIWNISGYPKFLLSITQS
jgi:hypothetical protein